MVARQLGRVALLVVLTCVPLWASEQLEPTDEQYRIYSAFLDTQLQGRNGIDDLRVGLGRSAISPNIVPFKADSGSKLLRDLKKQFPSVQKDTLNSLLNCVTKPYRLSRKLSLPVDYVFVQPDEEVVGQYGYVEFSCVGTNRDVTQAIFRVSRLRCDCAVSKWVLMQKDSSGRWAILKESIEWIA